MLAHSGSVLVLALVLLDMSCTYFCTNLIKRNVGSMQNTINNQSEPIMWLAQECLKKHICAIPLDSFIPMLTTSSQKLDSDKACIGMTDYQLVWQLRKCIHDRDWWKLGRKLQENWRFTNYHLSTIVALWIHLGPGSGPPTFAIV